ncbi:hypothetical protein EON67_00300 [archaeon]|nr:MAG: hypothetical protein EON67_00300 [archaeon]
MLGYFADWIATQAHLIGSAFEFVVTYGLLASPDAAAMAPSLPSAVQENAVNAIAAFASAAGFGLRDRLLALPTRVNIGSLNTHNAGVLMEGIVRQIALLPAASQPDALMRILSPIVERLQQLSKDPSNGCYTASRDGSLLSVCCYKDGIVHVEQARLFKADRAALQTLVDAAIAAGGVMPIDMTVFEPRVRATAWPPPAIPLRRTGTELMHVCVCVRVRACACACVQTTLQVLVNDQLFRMGDVFHFYSSVPDALRAAVLSASGLRDYELRQAVDRHRADSGSSVASVLALLLPILDELAAAFAGACQPCVRVCVRCVLTRARARAPVQFTATVRPSVYVATHAGNVSIASRLAVILRHAIKCCEAHVATIIPGTLKLTKQLWTTSGGSLPIASLASVLVYKLQHTEFADENGKLVCRARS